MIQEALVLVRKRKKRTSPFETRNFCKCCGKYYPTSCYNEKATEPLSTTQISEIISKKSRGEIFKLSATLKDSLEYRLKRDGYVDSTDMKNKSLYSITGKGRKLLKGWIAFLSAYS